MEMDDRGMFENEWSAAFEGAEQVPSSAVWDRIDMELVHGQSVIYQNRYSTMRWIAVAAVLLLLAIGSFSVLQWRKTGDLQSEILSLTQESSNSEDSSGGNESAIAAVSADTGNEEVSDAKDSGKPEDDGTVLNETLSPDRQQAQTATVIEKSNPQDQQVPITEMLAGAEDASELMKPELTVASGFGLTSPSSRDVSMVGTYAYSFDFTEESKPKVFWAGLDMSGGTYVPGGINMSLNSSDAASVEANFDQGTQTYSQSDISGGTRGYGIGVGTHVGERFSVQGGVQYASVQAGRYTGGTPYLANNVSNSRNNFLSNNSTGVFQVETFHFLSVPIRAGYYLFDRKLSMSVNPGIDSRFYVNRSTKRYVNGGSYTIDEVELNPVTFWGEISTDISYQLGDHYRVALSPSYKLSINSFEKNSGVHPALAEVAFSMRYLFK